MTPWVSDSLLQEYRVVSEPITPWCPLLDSRSRRSVESLGPRGEQGTSCPRQACGGVPSAFSSVGQGDTCHPLGPLSPAGIGLSPSESRSAHGTLQPVAIFSLFLELSAGREPLRTSPPRGGEMEAAFGSRPLPGASSCALAGGSGLRWSPGVPRLPPLTCGSSCFAGAAGCVATLLHDAAMNPAEGNDGPGLPGRGGSGAARAARVPSAAQRVLSSLLTRLQGSFGGQWLWLQFGSPVTARYGGG